MTVITTSTNSTATAYSNQRGIDRTSNGVLWTLYSYTTTASTTPGMAYSTNDGATWTVANTIDWGNPGGSTVIRFSYGTLFIDLDDYAHVIYKNSNDSLLYYRRGTPNAGRTAWTWNTPVIVGASNGSNYPSVVAHREGTGWMVHTIFSQTDGSGNRRLNRSRISVSDIGTVTVVEQGVSFVGTDGTNTTYWADIDFHHTGDSKTVKDGTPHLYVAWSTGSAGAGKGIRFQKATYSGGTWTWGTEREIDSTRYVSGASQFVQCLFDGTRVVIPGFLTDGTSADLILYERDSADTMTATRTLLDNATTADNLGYGSATYDPQGNVFIFGRENVANGKLNYRKWNRTADTLDALVTVDSASSGTPYVSTKRGYSTYRIEFIYTDGTTSPYNVTYDSISINSLPTEPTNVTAGARVGNNVPVSWTHNDPDNNPQSKYKFRWRKVI